MNFRSALDKAKLVFFFVFCYAITFNSVKADRSVRIVTSNLKSPILVHKFRSDFPSATYARRYGYGSPIRNYNSQIKYGRNKNYFIRRNGRFGPGNYAYRYKTWYPNRPYIHGGKYNPRVDGGKRRPLKTWKEPYPLRYYQNPKQNRKEKPHRISNLQRPKPPKPWRESDDDYFFPEETTRQEASHKFEIGQGRPKRKRKNPYQVEKVLKRPESKIPFNHGENPGSQNKRKKVRGPSFSYTTFVQHPSNDDEDYDEDVDGSEYGQQATKVKNKSVKKKSHLRKKSKDPDHHSEEEETPVKFPGSYEEDYHSRGKTFEKRRKKPNREMPDEEDHSSKSRPNRLSSDNYYGGYREKQNYQDLNSGSSYHPRPWSQAVSTTARPTIHDYKNEFQPQQFPSNQYGQQSYQSQYNNQNGDYSGIRIFHPPNAKDNNQHSNYYSQPEDSYRPVAFNSNNYYNNNPPPTVKPQISYNAYETYSNNPYTYQQQPSSAYDNSVLKNPPSHFSPQLPHDYNVKSQSYSFFDNGQKYGNRLSSAYPNGSQRGEDESDFLKKHQNLYNKGLSGVPIQGDGYQRENPKEYDIGYGDFQFVQVPSTD